MFYNMFVSMLAEFALLFHTFFRNDPPGKAPRRGAVLHVLTAEPLAPRRGAVLLKKALALSMQGYRNLTDVELMF